MLDVPAVIHIAGAEIRVGPYLRQRCGWCGAVLIDYDLDRVTVPVGQDPRPGTWPPGDLVAVDGAAWYTVPHADGDVLPEGSCANLDPEVTR